MWFTGCGADSAPTNEPEPQDDTQSSDEGAKKPETEVGKSDAKAATKPARDASAPRTSDARVELLDAAREPEVSNTQDAAVAVQDAAAEMADAASSAPFVLSSTVVENDALIPQKYRCETDGPGTSPPLAWGAGPEGTKSYAIAMRDITNSARTVDHWFIYDIPASTTSLPEGIPTGAMVAAPAGAKQGPNYTRDRGYQGPCAPSGTNRYELTLYALDVAALEGLTATATGAQILTQLDAHDLATTKLTIRSMAAR